MAGRGLTRGSHLRQVSTGSAETVIDGFPIQSNDLNGEIRTFKSPITQDSAPDKLHNRACLLWVHDDKFSKDEVLFNAGFFPDASVTIGDLIEVKPDIANSDIRDFQQKHGSKPQDPRGDGQSKRGTQPEKLPTTEQGLQQDVTRDHDSHKHCVFIVKPLPPEIKTKHPGLQVCSSILLVYECLADLD
jgi:DEP domain-containing protein 5